MPARRSRDYETKATKTRPAKIGTDRVATERRAEDGESRWLREKEKLEAVLRRACDENADEACLITRTCKEVRQRAQHTTLR